MSRIVLFGGAGYLGRHIREELAGRETVVPDRAAVDLLDEHALRATLQPGDIVINAAGYAEATDRTEAGIRKLRAANVEAVGTLARVGAEAGIGHLVHVSSVAAMGRLRGSGHAEESSGPLLSPYALSKRDGELVLVPYRDTIPTTVLRPTSVFGEGRPLSRALCRMARLPVIPLPGGGRAEIPFTYVKNVAQAIATAAGNRATFGETYIVGDDRSYPLRGIVLGLATRLGNHPRSLSIPVPLARAGVTALEIAYGFARRPPVMDRARLATLVTSVSYSTDKFRGASGFAPRFSFDQALDRIAAWAAGPQ